MPYTLSHKIGIISTIFFGAESATQSPEKQDMKKQILAKWPELTKFQDEPHIRFEARATLLAELTAIQKDPSKLKVLDQNDNTKIAIDTIINLLKTEKNPTVFEKTEISSTIGGRLIFSQKQQVRVFLGRLINNAQLINNFFSESVNRKPAENAETEHQISRLGRFLTAFEMKRPDKAYKTPLRQTFALLDKGDIKGAIELITPIIKENNLNIDAIIGTQQGLMNALRAISATEEASKITKEETENELKGEKLSPEKIALRKHIQEHFDTTLKGSSAQKAKQQYDATMTLLPDGHPIRLNMAANKDAVIANMAQEISYMVCVDDYIQKNGDTGLGTMLAIYNNMRGLHGHMSDENYHMTKEMAIMVASFALTAGIGPILGGIGIGARAIAGTNALRATTLAADASKAKTGMNAVGNGGKALARGTLVGTARVAEAGVVMNNAAQASKIARIPGEAMKFTSADALIREATRAEGDLSGFHGFADKLAMNGVMFGVFAGMEKFISGPALSAITKRFGIENVVATFALNGVVLSAGDIGVMQALHAAETGKFEWDWMSAYQALAFRIGMKGTEKVLPNLTKKWEAKTKKTEKAPEAQKMDSTIEFIPKVRTKINPTEQQYITFGKGISEQLRIPLRDMNAGLISGISPEGIFLKQAVFGKRIDLTTSNNPTTHISIDPANSRIYLKKQDGSHEVLQFEGNGSLKYERIVHNNSIATIESTPNDLGTNNSQESQKLVTITTEGGSPHEPQKGNVLGNSVQPKRISTSESASPSNKEGPQKYTGEADKFIISKSNKADIKQFQKEGFDLSEIGFEGWNVKQTQKKGISTFVLSHSEHGQHSFRSAKEVQEFLKPKDAPVVISSVHGNGSEPTGVVPQENGSRILVVPKQEQIRNYFNTFLRKELISGNSIPLDSIGLPGWRVKKLPKGNNSSDNVFELSIPGKDSIQVEGSGELQKRIQQEARKLLSGSVSSPSEGAKTDSRYDENGRLIDPQAKSRIENEHRMNTPPKSAQESLEVFSSRSFRKEMNNLMSLDDATFQQRYTELQSRGNVRMYEREMYEAAANVRKLSDAQIIEKAKGDIVENRQALRDASPQGEKARIVAENAALRYRLKNILKESGVDGPITEPPTDPEAFKKNFDKRWLLIPGILGLLLLLHKCQGGNEPTPLSSSPTVEEVYDACQSCYQGSKAVLNKTRKINGKEANDAYRLSVSQRWMQTQAWKDLEKNYKNNKTILPQNSDFAKAMDAILSKGGLTVENVQSLQHCIGMLDGNTSQDSKISQDGMLGKITTGKIAEYIAQCKATAGVTSE